MTAALWAAIVGAFILSQFFRAFLAVLYPVLNQDLGVTPTDLATAQSLWLIVFALAQFPVGWLLDKAGPRWMTAALLAGGAGGGSMLFAAAQAPWMITAAMALIGVGCSPILMAGLFLFGRLLPRRRFAYASGVLIGFGMLGNIAATAPLAFAADALGWRGVAWLLAGLSILSAASVLAAVRNPAAPAAGPGPAHARGGYWAIVRTPGLGPVLALAGIQLAAAVSLRGVWAGPYFAEIQGADAADVGLATLAMATAMAAGAFAYGAAEQRSAGPKQLVMLGNLLLLPGLLALALLPTMGAVPAIAAFAWVGFFGASVPVLLAHGRAFLPDRQLGRGVSLLNFFSIAGAGLAQYVGAGVRDAALATGAETAAAYGAVFWFHAVLLAAGLVVYAFARDAEPRVPRV